MGKVESLSSVGRELFFKNLLGSGSILYFQCGDAALKNFDKKSSTAVQSRQIVMERGKLFFRGSVDIDSAAKKSSPARLFFYANSVGYFCDIELSFGVTGAWCPVPDEIKKIQTVERAKSVILSGKLSYMASDVAVEINVSVPESYDALSSTNISKYLCDDFSSEMPGTVGLRKPLELLFVDAAHVVLGDRNSSYPFGIGQRYSIVLDFVLSPVIRRSVRAGCVVTKIESAGERRCFVCAMDRVKEEDSRFLSEGLSRFI